MCSHWFLYKPAIILNSNILQEPQGDQFSTGDVELNEVAGVTSITYTGNQGSAGYDPGRANVPRGGVLVSVGSSKGLGYQPLVTALVFQPYLWEEPFNLSLLTTLVVVTDLEFRHILRYLLNLRVLMIPTMFSIGTNSSRWCITSITVTNGGSGFSQSEPPLGCHRQTTPISQYSIDLHLRYFWKWS